jgi:hypothetical protein
MSASTAIQIDIQFAMSDEHPLLDDLTLSEKDHDWVDRELQNHYSSRRWHRRPTQGIFHHKSDNTWRLPDSRRAVLQRARVFVDLPDPDYAVDEYDCEEYAFKIYLALTMAYPKLSVGIAFNFAGGHVYNLFLTAEGEVIEYEPQTGEVVTDDNSDIYDFKNGILYL